MNLPWKTGDILPLKVQHQVRRQAAFQYHKWDQQVGDVTTFSPFPLVIDQEAWDPIVAWSELLATETFQLEQELLTRPDLHAELALPPAITRLLKTAESPSQGKARLIRFDFHFTTEGWRISEANTDVPGGWNEATGYPALLAPYYPEYTPLGGMIDCYAQALSKGLAPEAHIALVHATAYTDDRQAMILLKDRLEKNDFRSSLVSPDQVEWQTGQASITNHLGLEPVDLLVRYFPGEWLPHLPRRSSWRHFFCDSQTPISNPATALLTQSKRLPLIWDKLSTRLPTWRKLLPDCSDPRHVSWAGDPIWIVKPALGRVGHGIGMRDCLREKEWTDICSGVKRHPGHWVTQKRFQTLPLSTPLGDRFPCLGVYTIDAKVAGAYGRVSSHPLIDSGAQDIAVFLNPPHDQRRNF